MGSVHSYASKKGKRYLVRYRKPDGAQGSKRGFTRKRDAEIFLAAVETESARGAFIDPNHSRVRLGELGPAWLAVKKGTLKPSSFAPLEVAWRLRVEPIWGRWRIGDILPSDVHKWVAEMSQQYGASVTIRAYSVLAGILDTAVLDRRLGQNPARQGRIGLPKKMAGRHRYLSHQELMTLAYASGKHASLVLTLGYCGLRWGEAIGLRRRNLDVKAKRIHVTDNVVEVASTMHRGTPKSNRTRTVPVPTFVMDMLSREVDGRGADDLVFPGRDGGYMRRTRASTGSKSWFKNALREAGLEPMTLHELRHTAASLAVQSGAHVKAIQRMLGHSSAAMTLDVYSDLFEKDLDSISERLNDAALSSFFPNSFPEALPGPGQESGNP